MGILRMGSTYTNDLYDDDDVRLTEGPSASAQLNSGQSSPVKSIHATMAIRSMTSCTSLGDRVTRAGSEPIPGRLSRDGQLSRSYSPCPSPKTLIATDMAPQSARPRPSHNQSDTAILQPTTRPFSHISANTFARWDHDSPQRVHRPSWPATRRSVSAPIKPGRLPAALEISDRTKMMQNLRVPFPGVVRQSSSLLVFIRPDRIHARRRVAYLNLGHRGSRLSSIGEDEHGLEHKPGRAQTSRGNRNRHVDLDDTVLFEMIRAQPKRLLGRFYTFSARKVGYILVRGRASRTADAEYWSHGPIIDRGRNEGATSMRTQENMMRHLLEPEIGARRYAWVAWARNLANASVGLKQGASSPQQSGIAKTAGLAVGPLTFIHSGPESATTRFKLESSTGPGNERGSYTVASAPTPDLVLDPNRQLSAQPLTRHASGHDSESSEEGLELVLVWDHTRIALVTGLVLLLATMVVLSWTLAQGHAQATERVAGGFAFGGFVLIVQLVVMAGWIGANWLLL